MKKVIIFSIVLLFGFSSSVSGQDATRILESTMEAMGGLEKWKSIAQVTMNYAGHQYWLEQSENPDGPYLVSYLVSKEVHGVWRPILYKKDSTRHFQVKRPTVSENMINGNKGLMTFRGRSFPMPYQLRGPLVQWVQLAPEQLILAALKNNPDQQAETEVDGTPHLVITFKENRLERRLFINKHTRLLSKAEIESHQPNNLFDNPWGKYSVTIKYNLQWLHKDGIRYPAQWDVYKMGKPWQSITIFDISFQQQVDETLFKIPEGTPPAAEAVSADKTPLKTEGIIEVAPNIFTIPGSWHLGHVVQADGIVVIEGAISSGYSQQHLEFLRKRYPNKPIKAVIATSDAWPHIGGIREYAANEIPIYTHQLNQQIISDLLTSDRSLNPDSQALDPKQPNFNLIANPQILNDPETPIEIYPVNGEAGERMIALYFPKQKVLYASDLIQMTGRKRDRFFAPQYLSEVKALIDRHDLKIETVFAMHLSPIPWSRVTEALKAYQK